MANKVRNLLSSGDLILKVSILPRTASCGPSGRGFTTILFVTVVGTFFIAVIVIKVVRFVGLGTSIVALLAPVKFQRNLIGLNEVVDSVFDFFGAGSICGTLESARKETSGTLKERGRIFAPSKTNFAGLLQEIFRVHFG